MRTGDIWVRGTVVAIAVLVVAAGCVQPGGPDGEPPPANDEGEAPATEIRLRRPTILNATPPDGEVTLNITQYQAEDDVSRCGTNERAVLKVRLLAYDRAGPIWSTYYRYGLDEPHHEFRVPLEGTPPFLIIGDWSACIKEEHIIGAEDPYNLYAFNRTSEHHHQDVTVEVPPGENRSSTEWDVPAWTWRLSQARPESRDGERYGEIRLVSEPEGTVCSDRFTPMDQEIDCLPFVLYPGSYEVVVELDSPAVQETTWTYDIDAPRFHDGVCEFGFTWEGICG